MTQTMTNTQYPQDVQDYTKKVSRLQALGMLLEKTKSAILGEEPQTRRQLENVKSATEAEIRRLTIELKEAKK